MLWFAVVEYTEQGDGTCKKNLCSVSIGKIVHIHTVKDAGVNWSERVTGNIGRMRL